MKLKKYGIFTLIVISFLFFSETPSDAKDLQHLFSNPIELDDSPRGFKTLSRQFREQKDIRAAFKQNKKINVLRRPLISRGNIVFIKNKGLIWKVNKPFTSVMLINTSGIYQQRKNSLIPMLSVKENPTASGFMNSFLSLFSGDFSLLAEYYQIYYQKDGEKGWKIGFIPTREPHNRVIEKMILSGKSDAFFTSFQLFEKNGDQTEVTFTDIQEGNINVTPEELTLFEVSQ